MRNLHLKCLLAFCALICPALAYGQGGVPASPINFTGPTGRPLAGATVTVCTSAGTGFPCSPLASIFTDAGLSVASPNPVTTDGNGNIPVIFAAPGVYKLSVTGSGITSTLVTATVAGTGGGNVLSGSPNTFTAANTFTGGFTISTTAYSTSSAGTHSGTETYTGLVQCKNFENIRCVDAANSGAWAGTNPSDWINSAIANLQASFTSGIVDARGLMGALATSTTTVTVPAGFQVLLPPNTFPTSASPGFNLTGTAPALIGAGRNISIITCTGAASATCVNVAAAVRSATIRDMRINTTGTAGDAIVLQDNIGNVSIENLQLAPVGHCITGVVGAQGELFTHIMEVRCDGGLTPMYNFNMTGAGLWSTMLFDNVYASAGTGSNPVGFDLRNVTAQLNKPSSDLNTTGYLLNGTSIIMNGPECTSSATCISITGSGAFAIHNPYWSLAATVGISVAGVASTETFIDLPLSTGTVGANDITYSAGSTGNHILFGGLQLSKPPLATAPATVTWILPGSGGQNQVKTLNGSQIFTTTQNGPVATISGNASGNSQVMRIINTAGHTWDFGEIMANTHLSFRDISQTGGPAWSLLSGATVAAEGILSHNNTANRTYLFPDFTPTGMTGTIASGTAAMTTALIATVACGTTVTVAAPNVLTTDTIDISHNAAVTAANDGLLILNAWPTAGNVNFNYCNPGAAGQTPTAMIINWSVRRP